MAATHDHLFHHNLLVLQEHTSHHLGTVANGPRRRSSYGHVEVENVDQEVEVKEYVEVEES